MMFLAGISVYLAICRASVQSDFLAARVCGELLISPESAIRHTQDNLVRAVATNS